MGMCWSNIVERLEYISKGIEISIVQQDVQIFIKTNCRVVISSYYIGKSILFIFLLWPICIRLLWI